MKLPRTTLVLLLALVALTGCVRVRGHGGDRHDDHHDRHDDHGHRR